MVVGKTCGDEVSSGAYQQPISNAMIYAPYSMCIVYWKSSVHPHLSASATLSRITAYHLPPHTTQFVVPLQFNGLVPEV